MTQLETIDANEAPRPPRRNAVRPSLVIFALLQVTAVTLMACLLLILFPGE